MGRTGLTQSQINTRFVLIAIGLFIVALLALLRPQSPISILPSTTADNKAALYQAFNSVFSVAFPENETAGSCILVGRTLTEDGYRYRGVTAYHLFDGLVEEHPTPQASLTNLHWTGDRIDLNIIFTPEWLIPAIDFASFTFESDRLLSCCEVASPADIASLTPLDDIYIVANDNAGGLNVRRASIGSPTNDWPALPPHDELLDEWAWYNHPECFFRIMSFIWFGASGGGVFDSNGHLIGIINATSIGYDLFNQKIYTGFCALSLRMDTVTELLLENNPNFFLIEDK